MSQRFFLRSPDQARKRPAGDPWQRLNRHGTCGRSRIPHRDGAVAPLLESSGMPYWCFVPLPFRPDKCAPAGKGHVRDAAAPLFHSTGWLLIVGVRGLFTGKQKICFRNPVLRRFFFFHWWNGWSLRIFFRYGRRLLRRQWRVYRWLDMWRGSFAGEVYPLQQHSDRFCSAGSDQIPYDAAKNDQGNSGYYPLCLERRMPAVRGRRRRQLAA